MLAGNRRVQAEEILPLPDEDDHGDTRREADDYGIRDEADHAPELRESHREQHHARHQGRDLQPRDPVLRRDAGEHDDEGAGRPGDLHASTAQKRSREAGDDGRVEPLLGFRAGSDRKGHRERQRHDADDDARDEVSPDLGAAEEARAVRFEQGDHRGIGGVCPWIHDYRRGPRSALVPWHPVARWTQNCGAAAGHLPVE